LVSGLPYQGYSASIVVRYTPPPKEGDEHAPGPTPSALCDEVVQATMVWITRKALTRFRHRWTATTTGSPASRSATASDRSALAPIDRQWSLQAREMAFMAEPDRARCRDAEILVGSSAVSARLASFATARGKSPTTPAS